MQYLAAVYVFIFFFQAEDGIRDADVTGVQTCALPIFAADVHRVDADDLDLERVRDRQRDLGLRRLGVHPEQVLSGRHRGVALLTDQRALDDLDGGPHASHSSTWLSAERVKTTVSAVRTS